MDDKLLIALVAAGGAVLGVLVTTIGQIALFWLKDRPANRLAKLRKQLLMKMLDDQRWKWRKLTTLSHVIGADETTTKALLIDVGARASQDGSQLWGLISRNPLPEDQ
jgi:hypothetical protein